MLQQLWAAELPGQGGLHAVRGEERSSGSAQDFRGSLCWWKEWEERQQGQGERQKGRGEQDRRGGGAEGHRQRGCEGRTTRQGAEELPEGSPREGNGKGRSEGIEGGSRASTPAKASKAEEWLGTGGAAKPSQAGGAGEGTGGKEEKDKGKEDKNRELKENLDYWRGQIKSLQGMDTE